MSGVPGWAGRYIGLPWVDGGRDFSGVDCEGLCRLVLEHEAGDPPLPAYGIVSADGMLSVARALRQNAALPPFVSVDRDHLRAYDGVVMTGRERVDGHHRTFDCHIGVMVDRRQVLHIEAATRSVVVGLDHPSIRHRVRNFIRHEALT